jgi:hypothetical protein
MKIQLTTTLNYLNYFRRGFSFGNSIRMLKFMNKKLFLVCGIFPPTPQTKVTKVSEFNGESKLNILYFLLLCRKEREKVQRRKTQETGKC